MKPPKNNVMLFRTIRICLAALIMLPALACREMIVHAPPNQGRLQEALEIGIIKSGVPGGVLLVAGPGGKQWQGAFGVSKITGQNLPPQGLPWPPGALAAQGLTGTPLRPGQKFHVGSIEKTFVATLTLMLAGEGRLSLDDTLDQWLPGLIPQARQITIRQLLYHTSGLGSHTDHPNFYPDLIKRPRRPYSPRELIRYALEEGFYNKPGHGWHYSNTGYLLLGMIIEKAGQKPYRDQVAERLLIPLGLTDTSLPDDRFMPEGSCRGYRYDFLNQRGKWTDVSEYADPSFLGPAGSMISTAEDILKWLDILLSGRLIRPELKEEMFRFIPTDEPGRESGLGVERLDGAVGHAGDYPFGYQSWMFRSQGWDFVALVNGFPTSLKIDSGAKEIYLQAQRVLK